MKKFFRYKIKSKALATVLMLAIPVAALMLMESYTHVPWDLTPPIFILNLVGYYLIYLLGTFLSVSYTHLDVYKRQSVLHSMRFLC